MVDDLYETRIWYGSKEMVATGFLIIDATMFIKVAPHLAVLVGL